MSSRLLQTSAVAPAIGSQVCITPAMQRCTLWLQMPWPQVMVPMLSMVPSQLSSRLLQVSETGRTSPAQVPQTPVLQVWLPPTQVPTPSVPAGPV